MNMTNQKSKIADCEICDKVNVETWMMHGNILMCRECRENEQKVMIEESRTIDSNVVLKTDIFTVKTVAAVELRGAIEADESIPEDAKQYAYAKECMTRYKNLKKVIFEEELALNEKKNELRMWQVNVQESAGTLRAELKAQFKELDVNYQPGPITKQNKTTKPVKKFNKKELYEVAKKYGYSAQLVQRFVVAKTLSPEDACKFIQNMANADPVQS